MALRCLRAAIIGCVRSNASFTTKRVYSSMGDPIDHATGLEKRELLSRLAGNSDPYYMRMLKRGPGTKCEPNEVPSSCPQRLLGCICEEEAMSISYMWLHQGEPKRCECGFWFMLVHVEPL